MAYLSNVRYLNAFSYKKMMKYLRLAFATRYVDVPQLLHNYF